jgi:hypothetical protein
VSENPGAQECRKCSPGSIAAIPGRSSCTLCDLGEFTARDRNAAWHCDACPAGWFQDEKKQLECKACPVNSYHTRTRATSMSECVKCSEERTTGNLSGSTSIVACICRAFLFYEELHYKRDNSSGEPACTPCPVGAVCPIDGSELTDLFADTGFFQPQNITSEFIDCASAFADSRLGLKARERCCNTERCGLPRKEDWSPDSQCMRGYNGPLCTSCAEDFVLFQGNCIECDGGSPLYVGIVGLVSVALFVFFVAAKIISSSTLESDGDSYSDISLSSRLGGLASIMITWLQILSALTVTYKMPWPVNFAMYSRGAGSLVNMEILEVLAIGDCQLAVPFINSFLLGMLTIPIFSIAVLMALYLVQCRKKRKKDKKNKKDEIQKLGPIILDPQKMDTDNMRMEGTAFKLIVLIVQLLYPKLSTKTFQMFRCVDFGPRVGLLLDADFSKKCYEGIHRDYVPFAVVSMVLYLTGVPICTFWLLYRNRKKLHTPYVRLRYGDLYLAFEHRWYFWECILMVQKCMLTGAMVAVAPGSSVQLLVALFVSGAYLLLQLHANPYLGYIEDRLAFTTTLCLGLTLVFGFALITDDLESPTYEINQIGTLLIFVNIIPVVLLSYSITVIIRYGKHYGLAEDKIAMHKKNLKGMIAAFNRKQVVAPQLKSTKQSPVILRKAILARVASKNARRIVLEHNRASMNFHQKVHENQLDARHRLFKRIHKRGSAVAAPIAAAPRLRPQQLHIVKVTNSKASLTKSTLRLVKKIRKRARKKIKTHVRLVGVFHKLDLDGSGRLGKDEFLRLIAAVLGGRRLDGPTSDSIWADAAGSRGGDLDIVAVSAWLELSQAAKNAPSTSATDTPFKSNEPG